MVTTKQSPNQSMKGLIIVVELIHIHPLDISCKHLHTNIHSITPIPILAQYWHSSIYVIV